MHRQAASRRIEGRLIANCLVIGGGFLGAHLAERLARDSHDVAVYSRSFSDRLAQRPQASSANIRLIDGEVPPGQGLMELLAHADVVFYMAGGSTPAVASSDPGGSIIRHVVPAAAVLDLMRDTTVRRVVIASSGGTVYGVPTELPTPEDHPTKPISLHGHHALTVERYAQFFAERHGFSTVILRFSNPYGPGQIARRGQGVIAAWSHALAHDEPLIVYGDPETRRDFIYIDDLVEATALAGLTAPPGIYNVGSGVATPLREVIETLVAEAGRPADVVHADPRPVDVPVTQLECSRLRRVTGWRAEASLLDGITTTLAWTRAVATVAGSQAHVTSE